MRTFVPMFHPTPRVITSSPDAEPVRLIGPVDVIVVLGFCITTVAVPSVPPFAYPFMENPPDPTEKVPPALVVIVSVELRLVVVAGLRATAPLPREEAVRVPPFAKPSPIDVPPEKVLIPVSVALWVALMMVNDPVPTKFTGLVTDEVLLKITDPADRDPSLRLPPFKLAVLRVTVYPPKSTLPPVILNVLVEAPSAKAFPKYNVPPSMVVPPENELEPVRVCDPVDPEARSRATVWVPPSEMRPPKL